MEATLNKQRAEYARIALEAFCERVWKGERLEELHAEDHEDLCADIISDVMHYAKSKGINPIVLVARAQQNYESDILDEEVESNG